MNVIDFHNHHIPARFEQAAVRTAPANQRARWEALARSLSDEDLLLDEEQNAIAAGNCLRLLGMS